METKLSILKLYIIVSMMIWSFTGTLGILYSYEIKGLLFYVSIFISSVFFMFILNKKYKPVLKNAEIHNNFILCEDKYIINEEIIKVFRICAFEKILFTLKSPEFDYSTSLLKQGCILKVRYDSYLVDSVNAAFFEYKKIGKSNNHIVSIIALCLFTLLPVIAAVLIHLFNIDSLTYTAGIIILYFFIIQRLLPPFYLGEKINIDTLPLIPDELGKFKNIIVIKGFAFSDKLAVVPFKKPVYLDGLAVDILFRRYIVLNPRLFSQGSKDYLRFVLFHELSHIKHHDSSGVFILSILIIILDIMTSLIPPNMISLVESKIPYYDYVLIAIAALYFIIVLMRRKNIERRADRDGIQMIGEDAAARIYEDMGIDLRNVIR